MTKLKLLSSLTVLLVALSTAGCTVEDDTTLEDTIPQSSESSGSTSGSGTDGENNNDDDTGRLPSDEPHSGYYGFTLAFTFTDSDGNATLLEDNATAYILGGWDNWATYTPLTYNDGYYCMTFDKIETGTYRYKMVMWFSDEDVSWLNCVEITEENQTLRIRTDYTDYYTLNLSLTLDVSLPTDEERQNKLNTLASTIEILEAASEVGCLSNLWTSVHIKAETADDKTSYDVCLNPDNELFADYWGLSNWEWAFIYGIGSYEEYEWNTADYYYYINGLTYDYFTSIDNRDNSNVTVDYLTTTVYTFEDFVQEYSKVFEDASDLINLINTGVDSDGKAVYYSVSTEGNEYTLVVNSEAKGVYTYKCTSDFEFTYLAYENEDGYKYEVEATTISEIEEKVTLLRASFDLCIEPMDVINKLYADTNYSVQYEFEQMITDDYVTYGEYEAASDSEKSSIEENLKLNFELINEAMFVCYSDDAIFISYGRMDDNGRQNAPQYLLPVFMSDYGVLLVNSSTSEGDFMSVYLSGDYGASWELGSFTDINGVVHASEQPIYEGHWQDYCYSIADCYGNITEEDFYYYGLQQRYAAVGGYTGWLFNTQEANDLMFKCLGGEFFFGKEYNEYLSTLMDLYLFCYDPCYQTSEATYYYEGFFPDEEDFLEEGWEISDDTHLYIRYLQVTATIENMGRTDIADYIDSWRY